MRSVFCAYGSVGCRLIEFVATQAPAIDSVFIRGDDPHKSALLSLCQKHKLKFFEISNISDKVFSDYISSEDIDIVFLLWWPDIIPLHLLKHAKRGYLNLHPSFLPHNRGMHPYYWSIVENTPAGVSIHFIDERIDAGRIVWWNAANVASEYTILNQFKQF